MLESIYPSEDGRSIFDNDPKLKAKLEKEYVKGTIKLTPPSEEEPLDADFDLIISRSINDVWSTYDPKNTGFMDKKNMEKFLKDALHVWALRRGGKSDKDAITKGVNASEAMKNTILMINKSQTGKATRVEFEDFIYTYDMQEALGYFLGNTNGMNVDFSKVSFMDLSSLQSLEAEKVRPVYRDYPDD